MTEFSGDAKLLMCGLFAFGRGTVKSAPPHKTYNSMADAFQELQDHGLITREAFNQFDIWIYKPTPALREEAEKHRHWYFSRVL